MSRRISQLEADQIWLLYREIDTTYRELAEVTGWSLPSIYRIINGEWNPPVPREDAKARDRERRRRNSKRWRMRNPEYDGEYIRRPEVRERRKLRRRAQRAKVRAKRASQAGSKEGSAKSAEQG